jgi:Capsule polysaccharide biosynthesis protein
LIFHRRRPDLLLDVADDWPEWDQRPLGSEESEELDRYLIDRELGARTLDRYWTHAEFVDPDRPATGKLAVLFTNLTWDSAVLGKEVAFPGIHEWLFAAVDTFAHRPNDQLLIRVHPAEVKLPGKQTREPLGGYLRQDYGDLPPNVRIVDADDPLSSYPLMAAADVGLVYTSTTGLEMALRGKPVIVAGRTHYRGKGFTLDVSSPTEFAETLEQALDNPAAVVPDLERVRRYAHLFFFRAPVGAPGVEEHVPGLARLTIRSLDELSPGRSAAVDRICDVILGGGTARDQAIPNKTP